LTEQTNDVVLVCGLRQTADEDAHCQTSMGCTACVSLFRAAGPRSIVRLRAGAAARAASL
jgi:hypothetical protein